MTMQNAWGLRAEGPEAGRPSLEAFFSYGFRPFFLGAAVFAALLMSLWLGFVADLAAGGTGAWLRVAGSPYAWHAHEMVFGFAAAAIAGFLLTAVPNWTGALPLSGAPLTGLFLLWCAGRLAMAFSGWLPPLAAAIDIAFLPVLGAVAAQQLFLKPAARNLVFLVLIAVLVAGNVVFHLAAAGLIAADPLDLLRQGLLVVGVMIAIIGGRIIPAFTHNWLNLKRPAAPRPRRIGPLDAGAIVSIAAILLARLLGAPAPVEGAIALLAATLNGVRLALWRGWETRSEPIVWILHAGYAWLVIALALMAAASLTDIVPASLAHHALGTGAVGVMILAVMSRASLGHTGRRIVAPRAVVVAYGLANLAAVLRVAGPLLAPELTRELLVLAGVAWIGAFSVFAAVYAPILTTPRVPGRLAPV